jgi:hypothetical protein
MKEGDGQFLAGLGFDESRGGGWRLFLRRGNVLLVLPDSPGGVRKGLRLYRPQRALAALMVRLVGAVPFGMRLLRRWQADLRAGGPVSEIVEKLEGSLAGVLLGNPKQEERRAILLIDTKGGTRKVVKVGTTPAAIEKIRREMSFLRENAWGARMIPQVESLYSGEDWAAFEMAFQDSPKVLSRSELCDLFRVWISDSVVRPLEEFEEWQDLRAVIVSHETGEGEVARWDTMKLRKSIRHGDFAPWNILGSEQGDQATVIDWEFGRVGSLPGLDLVHYLFIPAILVDGMTAIKALDFVRELLQSDPEFRQLLDEWGWHERVDLLLKTYFYAMKGELENFSEMARAV